MPGYIVALIVFLILLALYGVMAFVAERGRIASVKAREQGEKDRLSNMIAAAKAAAAEGTLVSFDHGGSKINNVQVTEANDGVFYYTTDDAAGTRRASYEMVADFQVS